MTNPNQPQPYSFTLQNLHVGNIVMGYSLKGEPSGEVVISPEHLVVLRDMPEPFKYQYRPIPISEWLEKSDYEHITELICEIEDNTLYNFVGAFTEDNIEALLKLNIHDFQNLYSALSGEELTLKEGEK